MELLIYAEVWLCAEVNQLRQSCVWHFTGINGISQLIKYAVSLF